MTIKKRVLVLGASGFVGFSIFEALSKREDLEVWGTYKKNLYRRLPDLSYISNVLQVDLTRQNDVNDIFSNFPHFDIVIQAAAYSTGAKDAKTKPWVQITPNAAMNSWVIQSAFENNVSQYIYLSCSVMYEGGPCKETDVDKNNLPEVYRAASMMKLYGEELCYLLSKFGCTKFTVLRPSNIYGSHDRFDPDRSHVFGATIRKVLEAQDGKVVVWGKGQEVRDFLYVDDFVRFVELVIDRQNYAFDVFNVGLGQSVTIEELVKKVIQASGKDLKIVYDPDGPSIGTKISLNIDKAKAVFGWQPEVSLDEGIARTIDWYRRNHVTQK